MNVRNAQIKMVVLVQLLSNVLMEPVFLLSEISKTNANHIFHVWMTQKNTFAPMEIARLPHKIAEYFCLVLMIKSDVPTYLVFQMQVNAIKRLSVPQLQQSDAQVVNALIL